MTLRPRLFLNKSATMAWTSTASIFSSLGVRNGDTYTANDDCLEILEEILRNLETEDCRQRPFRRSVGNGQNIKKNLLPLLIATKDESIVNATKIIDTTIKILVNLTIPVEYLLAMNTMRFQQYQFENLSLHDDNVVTELHRLLSTSKEAFTDSRSTKAIVDHIKYFIDKDAQQLDLDQCDSINNCLLLLRNILHIPEIKSCNSALSSSPMMSGCSATVYSTMQNQIVWNLFTQSIDKIIIYLMSCPQKMYWGVTMVQVIALIYKDQHVGTLQKLLNLWLEASFSESSDDNESNTSPPDQGSGDDSSPIITSDPTSDSSDTGGSCDHKHQVTNCNNAINTMKTNQNQVLDRKASACSDLARCVAQNRNKSVPIKRVKSTETELSNSSSGISSMGQSNEDNSCIIATENKSTEREATQSEISDCGYVTQVENQESISTSSNDDDQPHQKPVHQKPHTFQKTRYISGKSRATSILEKKELRRKKLVKRSKNNIIKMKGLIHHLPTDEDIANIIKEFTVDFLLKGYSTLVYDLYTQLLTNIHIPIDTSHFFWLVTYFLKFATQLELDLEHVSPVLSYEIFSYLIFQGVWVYEELEILCRIPEADLKPCLRRLHLVVTAIREFLHGVESYQKMIHLNDDDRKTLRTLQLQISQTDDLRSLFVLLLRQYNPNMQSKQYLQDLILTNHNYLLFLDNSSKLMENGQEFNIMDHLKQFATVEIMRQYGLLLENFKENGEFVNNCIFTMMHHIGGDLQHVSTLFQPNILKTFSQIWETDYEICDDWCDLIEYVIHKFINTPRTCSEAITKDSRLETLQEERSQNVEKSPSIIDGTGVEWTKEEQENLLNYYNQSRDTNDTIANITKKYEENGTRNKTHLSIIGELLKQNIINDSQYNEFATNLDTTDNSLETITELDNNQQENEADKHLHTVQETLNCEESLLDSDIKVLKEYFIKENKNGVILWLQNILLETCFVKLILTNVDEFKENSNVVKPTVYYFAFLNLPIPLVPWTTEQANSLKLQPFILLLHKLGFYLPLDTGKIFVRIPNFWNAAHIFSMAQQLGPIDPAKLKFDVRKLKGSNTRIVNYFKGNTDTVLSEYGRFSMTDLKQAPSMVRYTPLPNSADWFHTVLQNKLGSNMDGTLPIPSTNQLSISIPETDRMLPVPAPELCLVTSISKNTPTQMECSPIHESECLLLNDDIERTSTCGTASVASDLTRMCVSDEEEKIILLLDEKKN